ncbi:MAG TPA: hypothetical protein VI461_00360 [Chitinophagaceae bacterium]|nr:hypothetical protein [Chitinophagaceae bacterium]
MNFAMKWFSFIPTLLFFTSTFSQQGKTQTKQGATGRRTDTLAVNLLNTLSKLSTVATDPKKSGFDLAQNYLETNRYQEGIYRSRIQLPGSVNTTVSRGRTSRATGTTNWNWHTILIAAPKGSRENEIKAMQLRIDSIIGSFNRPLQNDNKHQVVSVSSYSYINKTYMEGDELGIYFVFTKPATNTEQQAIDSLALLYKSYFTNPAVSAEAAEKFLLALDNEGLSKQKISGTFTPLFIEAANVNINAAFKILMGIPGYIIEPTELKAALPYNQQQQITAMAKQIVDDFYAKQEKRTGQGETIRTENTQTTGTNAASDMNNSKCKENLKKQKYKTGTYIPRANCNLSQYDSWSDRISDAYIKSYDCNTGRYKIVVRVYKAGNEGSFWERSTASYYSNAGEHEVGQDFFDSKCSYSYGYDQCTVCSTCKGIGRVLVDRTQYMKGYYVKKENYSWNLYYGDTPVGNYQQLVGCGACNSLGLIIRQK